MGKINNNIRGKRAEIMYYDDYALPSYYRYLYDLDELDKVVDCLSIFDYTYQDLEKYEPICQEIQEQLDKKGNKKLQEFFSYYEEHPCAFYEQLIGIKLPWYQKLFIKTLDKIDNIWIGRRK